MMLRRSKNRAKSLVVNTEKGKNDERTRRLSLPTFRRTEKGIMKIITADDSIHSKYGESKEESPRTCRITFKDIHIREFERTVGDNPSCSSGPPISIGWNYDPETKIISIDDYENFRGSRRTHFEMVLPRTVRDQMLRKEWGVPRSDIASAVRQNIKIKNQRRATVNNLGKADKFEEMMEKTGRNLMRGLLLRKSTSQKVAELEQQYLAAEKQYKEAAMKYEQAEQERQRLSELVERPEDESSVQFDFEDTENSSGNLSAEDITETEAENEINLDLDSPTGSCTGKVDYEPSQCKGEKTAEEDKVKAKIEATINEEKKSDSGESNFFGENNSEELDNGSFEC